MSRRMDMTAAQVRSVYEQLHISLDERVAREFGIGDTDSSEQQQHRYETGGKDDELLKSVKFEIERYLHNVIEMSGNSIRIDRGRGTAAATASATGRASSTTTTAAVVASELATSNGYIEEFDTTLNETVREKYQEWEDLTVKLSQLRAQAPQEINNQFTNNKMGLYKQIDTALEQTQKQKQPPQSDPKTVGNGDGTAGVTDECENGNESEAESEMVIPTKSDYHEILTNVAHTAQQLPSHRQQLDSLRGLVAFLDTASTTRHQDHHRS
ncbi:hypothetical protein Kpol_1060p34 [Vanderwaltozyma polyspora DSM 70294]|uniref:Uncharacterized protein n=1 Tax=Vanderwaltozyma polyspora (strain ATCC 22028 / DSM 70294 / BCRC 21397 / CBS 2163 / NBRC 10782 / NRRL Y-8283 / UCD 57-17) TaxID=436907 RepID=A7TK32_VANPO|nr:uncharacterized protein Kpol_1060p34 [Vanderwaltozyma polyspora DSM 70294]EDO17378.1 hypothetical protein Kpol_1060p34 [Vanderwaltozyma polyspora DSM 70294]